MMEIQQNASIPPCPSPLLHSWYNMGFSPSFQNNMSGLVARPQAMCLEGMGSIPIQVARVFVGVSSLNPLVWVAALVIIFKNTGLI
jgi:hypothetical protein